MTRVALYARYSDELQRDASIEDQFRVCRAQASREGWRIVATYKDAAISGASVVLRPGIQTLLQDARRGDFDVVLAEALDRISRDQADIATLFKHMRFSNVAIVTLAEGEISELHVGLKGTMNALFLKDLAAKTHRGLRGRVEHGKSGGGIPYGYRIVKQLDHNGELQRGDREIIEHEANIVRRIFREFAAGDGPRLIAKRLNDEGIRGPNDAPWIDTTIRGHIKRGTGLVNNELYIGRLVWNRQRMVKDPTTGRRLARLNPESEWVIVEVPHLRIVDDELWRAAKGRQSEIAVKYANVTEAIRESRVSNSLNEFRRPKSLLSGLIFCGCCGGPYSIKGPNRFYCSAYVVNGSCANSRSIPRDELEARTLAGLKDRLMAPEVAAEALRAYAEETNRLNHERRASGAGYRAELAKIGRTLKQMLTVIEEGGYTRGMTDRMREMEAREDELNALLAKEPVDIPDIHPNAAEIYRRKVERLAEALNAPEDRTEASTAIRALVEKIVLTPGPDRGEINATLHGELGSLLAWIETQHIGKTRKTNAPEALTSGALLSVGAGTGFEPVTFRL
jgi:site-specific DNA recombinase